MWAYMFLIMLSACGFRPLYQQDDAVSSQLRLIEVAPMPGRPGQIVHKNLTRLLDPRASSDIGKRYRLDIELEGRTRPVAIEQDRRISRYDAILNSKFVLRDLHRKEVLEEGRVKTIASYNVVDSDFATFIAEQDAYERAAKTLAEDYRLRLLAILEREL